MLLTYSSTPNKGFTTTVTLNKNDLSNLSNDPWWQDIENIVTAIVTLKSVPGKGKLILSFDLTQNPCTDQLTLPLYTRNNIQIDSIILIDTMGDKTKINRNQILVVLPNLADSDIDLNNNAGPYLLDEGDFSDSFSGTLIDEGLFTDSFSGISIDSGNF